jgi:hypothetical protein
LKKQLYVVRMHEYVQIKRFVYVLYLIIGYRKYPRI